MNYKYLNLIKKVFNFPFVLVWRILTFIFTPAELIIGFLSTNWEEKWDRDYFWQEIKKSISFGFWK